MNKETEERIKQEAEKTTDNYKNSHENYFKHAKEPDSILYNYEEGYIAGASAYATEMDELQEYSKNIVVDNKRLREEVVTLEKDNDKLNQWKSEAILVLNPIWLFADDNLEVPLGKSKTQAVIDHIGILQTNLSQMTDRATSAINMVNSLKKEKDQLRAEVERRNKLLEDDLKRQVRLNMPGASEQKQESAWQAFKVKNNLQEHGEKGGEGE